MIGRVAAACIVASIGLVCASTADCADQDESQDDEPSVTPYRPSVANPAVLPVPGYLELELGGLSVHAEDGSRTDTVPWLLKYAFTENSGLLLGGDAIDRLRYAGTQKSGIGDTYLEWKGRLPVKEGIALGLEAGVQAPTAPSALGIGKPAFIVNGILSVDIGESELDINLGTTRFSATPAYATPWQTQWALQLSQPINHTVGLTLEISGTAQRSYEHSHQALAAINYNASRRMVFDCGVAYGLDRAAHEHHLFCGGAFLLGKLVH